ncbi:hypothetical protein GIY62_01215 [Burkholderia plantarii]|uniref:hypothetical protein n=1 Tax=Burkholderia plantarii TaxID=41899 RepID=UPI00272D80CE|nr:hypothetical protein [Burkholderia plantarii]WLE59351.1 hypothetical protein GIY62_01215 [Burkholderia plantarii]
MKYPLLALLACSALAGCINLYGPGARGGGFASSDSQQADQQNSGKGTAAKGTGGQSNQPIVIGNRKYEEVLEKVGQFYADQKLAVRVDDRETGLVASAYSTYPNAGNFLDCSALKQTSNVTNTLKVITRVDQADQGVTVSVDVSGTASVIADGKAKVARVACRSKGVLEAALAAALRK